MQWRDEGCTLVRPLPLLQYLAKTCPITMEPMEGCYQPLSHRPSSPGNLPHFPKLLFLLLKAHSKQPQVALEG